MPLCRCQPFVSTAPALLITAALTLLLSGPVPARAQTLTVGYGWTQPGIEDVLERPSGFGASLDVPVGSRLSVRILARHHTERHSLRRSPCTGLARPGADCSPEPFDGEARLTTAGIGIGVTLPRPTPRVEPRLFATGLVADVDVTFRAAESDARVSPVTPDRPSVGFAGGGILSLALGRPVAITARAGVQYNRFSTCGDDAWFPFCDSQWMPQVSLGVEVDLSEVLRSEPAE